MKKILILAAVLSQVYFMTGCGLFLVTNKEAEVTVDNTIQPVQDAVADEELDDNASENSPTSEDVSQSDTVEIVTDYDYSNMSDDEIIAHAKAQANSIIQAYCGKTAEGSYTSENISNEDIMKLYDKAYDLVCLNLFSGWKTLGLDQREPVYFETVDYGVIKWYCADTSRFRDFKDMCEQYFSCLSDDFVLDFLGDEFALVNGKVYYPDSGDWGDSGEYTEVVYDVLDDGNGCYTVLVTVNYFGNYENPDEVTGSVEYRFPCVYEDGAWVFTDMHWLRN